MALPPKGDPRRPLHLAVRSTRMLAILFLCFATCIVTPIGAMRMRAPVKMNVMIVACYAIPGGVYLIFSIYMKERKFWAILASLIIASAQFILTLIATAAVAINFFLPNKSIALFPLAVLIFVLAALGELIYHLALSFNAIKYVPLDQQRGFEPLMPLSRETTDRSPPE